MLRDFGFLYVWYNVHAQWYVHFWPAQGWNLTLGGRQWRNPSTVYEWRFQHLLPIPYLTTTQGRSGCKL
eukprot:3838412-Amphidinium_carterae.1